MPYSITASSVTGRPLHRQNVSQHPATGQKNRKRHQEVPPTSPQPLELPEGRVSGCPPTSSAFESLSPPAPAVPAPKLEEAWAAAWKSAAPPQNPGWGWGGGGKLQSCSCNMLKKKKKKATSPNTRVAPLIPQSFARSTLTTGSPSLCSAKGTWLLDLGWGYFLSC